MPQYANVAKTTSVKDLRESWIPKVDKVGYNHAPCFTDIPMAYSKSVHDPMVKETSKILKETVVPPGPEPGATLPPEVPGAVDVKANYMQLFHATKAVDDYLQSFNSVSGDAGIAFQVMEAVETVWQRTELRFLAREPSKKATASNTGEMSGVVNYLENNREMPAGITGGVYDTATDLTTAFGGLTANAPKEMNVGEFNKVLQKIAEQAIAPTVLTVIAHPVMISSMTQFTTASARRSVIDTPAPKKGATISDYVSVYESRLGFICHLKPAPYMPVHTQKGESAYDVAVLDYSHMARVSTQGLKYFTYGRQGISEGRLVTHIVSYVPGNTRRHGSFISYKPKAESN